MICRIKTASGQSYEQLREILLEEGAIRIITPHRRVRVVSTAKDLRQTQCTRCGRYFIQEDENAVTWLDRQGDAFAVHCDVCKAVIDGVEDPGNDSTLVSHRSQKRLRRKERRALHNGHRVEEYIDYSEISRGRLVRPAKSRLVRSKMSSRH